MYIRETYINRTENIIHYESPVYDSIFEPGKNLFKNLQKHYGKCTGKVYIDIDTKPCAIGYVFEHKAYYTDTHELYVEEVWIEFHKKEPTTTTQYFYQSIEELK